jgi:hypothetical protein
MIQMLYSRRNRMSRAAVVLVVLVSLSPLLAATADQGASAPAAQPAGQKPKPAPPTTETPVESAPMPQQQPRTASQLANIRVELTITDQRGAAAAAPKTVSMLVADRFNGRIRTSGSVRVGPTYQPITLNVDAQPEILRDGRIRVQVNLEYRAQNTEGGSAEDNQPSNLVESFSVILEDGKPMLVTQSADPASDRKVRLDLKATLLK